MAPNAKEGFDYFSAGLGKKGKLASWGVAIGAVVAWNYFGGKNQVKEFTTEERERWNQEKKRASEQPKD
eukprot:CAMPEP_0202482134 /NCGR_PEP_ID=MMETSP1361-20130828/1567_1 /ASSEMBLY_ACC=CAM_ASM_000849 /TAXON_ID=210615 /ORGANISM="Staurosira complex sp., Strain CCMP2646" /LENGTH=68 /DNA_ID=CAMNT_0049109883 /DNA_START=137 /DNA_END=343 /DNA_ORIENTATION=-